MTPIEMLKKRSINTLSIFFVNHKCSPDLRVCTSFCCSSSSSFIILEISFLEKFGYFSFIADEIVKSFIQVFQPELQEAWNKAIQRQKPEKIKGVHL